MAQSFSDIKRTVAEEMEAFNAYYLQTLQSDKNAIREAVDYMVKMQGKQLRPLMVLLSGGMHGPIGRKTYVACTVIELTHLASLIHDDIVDEAYCRRGIWSFNALWRSKKAVLIGDYVFSRAIRTASENGLYGLLDDISRVIESMSVGELQQSDAAMRLDITEPEYYEVIRHKTADLMGSCLFTGALAAGADREACEAIRKIGLELGIIFQIKDDILDYAGDPATGKPACNDIQERKITLPLICALNDAAPKEKTRILSAIRHITRKPQGAETVLRFVREKDGIAKAEAIMREKTKTVAGELRRYPESKYRDALIALAEYICDRDH